MRDSRFPSASSGQALTRRTARFGMTSILLSNDFTKCFKVSPNVLGLVLGFPSLGFILGDKAARRVGKQVPHRAYRPIRNDIGFQYWFASFDFPSLDFNGATVQTNFERFTSCLPAVCFSQALTWKSNSSRVRRARSHQRCNLPMGKADRTASIAVRKWKASSYKPPQTKKAQNKLP
jgi:hypothetical protein